MDQTYPPCQIIRTKRRKTAHIRVEAEKIEVRIPHWVSEDWVDQWLSDRADWIQVKWREAYATSQRFQLRIEQGAFIPFLGSDYTLEWTLGKTSSVVLCKDRIQIVINTRSSKSEQDRVKQTLQNWYKQQANKVLSERLEYWQPKLGLYSNDMKIRGYKRRWGSCTASGLISFNWKLVLAEQNLIDYVVIHEIAHLQHLNHSQAFWNLVSQYCPEWKDKQGALQQRSIWLD